MEYTMNVRWMAVLTGFLVDVLISAVLFSFARADFFSSPDLTRPGDMILLCLSVALTAVSGYVAGRMAQTNRTLHGLLVQIVSILVSQLGPPPPRVVVITYGLSCLFAALGGYLSRYPAQRQPRSPNER